MGKNIVVGTIDLYKATIGSSKKKYNSQVQL